MYGFIHLCLEDLVIKLFGDETWKEILSRSDVKLRGASFLMHKVYDDEVTIKLVTTTSEVVGLDVETCLEAFGGHFLKYCQKNGYDKILRVLGSNLYDFLTNLDNLHDHLSSIYPGMRAPSFRVTNIGDGSMHLHYYSDRKGLSAIVRGLVVIVSKEFFDTEVLVRTLEECDDGHVILEVVLKDSDSQENGPSIVKLTPYQTDQQLSATPSDLLFSSHTICEAFPFHLMFRRDFRIIQIGNSLKKLTHYLWSADNNRKAPKFSDLFFISRPHIDCTFESILNYCNQVFVVKSTDLFMAAKNKNLKKSIDKKPSEEEQGSETLQLRLKGQMVPVPESNAILFLCSPRVNGLDEMKRLGLYMTDIPVHDRTRDLILMSHQRRGERELVEKLDEATNHIRILDAKVRDENKRTEEILHNIFPAKIARLLCQNIRVESESFEPVSCLFSDIVGFTAMCGHKSVEPMDVVRLLNKLYIQFDHLTTVYGVYKVETIGDAYVVVGGLPEMVVDHADRVIHMGLAMINVTQTVSSPVDGKPIQMRIGIHSGSCMAGIVGLQMPRYCLFGNTVTLANKMESNSQPGRVHISEETKKYLTKSNYTFTPIQQNVFPFPTYLVTKAVDSYRMEETAVLSVETNLSTAGGHFISPSCSPVHTQPHVNNNTNTRDEPQIGAIPMSVPVKVQSITVADNKLIKFRQYTNNYVINTCPFGKIVDEHHQRDTPPVVKVSSPTLKHTITLESDNDNDTNQTVDDKRKTITNKTTPKNRLKKTAKVCTESPVLDNNGRDYSLSKSADIDSKENRVRKRRFRLLCFGCTNRRHNNNNNNSSIDDKSEMSPKIYPKNHCQKLHNHVNSCCDDQQLTTKYVNDNLMATTSQTNQQHLPSQQSMDRRTTKRRQRFRCLPFI